MINLVLEAGAVSETVEISGQGALIDTTTATFGKVIENRRVQEAPLNGRITISRDPRQMQFGLKLIS